MNWKRIHTWFALAIVFGFFAGSIRAEDPGPDKQLNDPLLEKLIGDWKVDRTFQSGRKFSNTVHAEWVLQHHFVELHYRDFWTPPHYEAIILIGYDSTAKRYIAHWSDVFGGSYSTDGFAQRDEKSDA